MKKYWNYNQDSSPKFKHNMIEMSIISVFVLFAHQYFIWYKPGLKYTKIPTNSHVIGISTGTLAT